MKFEGEERTETTEASLQKRKILSCLWASLTALSTERLFSPCPLVFSVNRLHSIIRPRQPSSTSEMSVMKLMKNRGFTSSQMKTMSNFPSMHTTFQRVWQCWNTTFLRPVDRTTPLLPRLNEFSMMKSTGSTKRPTTVHSMKANTALYLPSNCTTILKTLTTKQISQTVCLNRSILNLR